MQVITVEFFGGPACGESWQMPIRGDELPPRTQHRLFDGREYAYVRRRGLHGNWSYHFQWYWPFAADTEGDRRL